MNNAGAFRSVLQRRAVGGVEGGIRCPWCPKGFQSTEPPSLVKNSATQIQRRIPVLRKVQPRRMKHTYCVHTGVFHTHIIC